MKVSLHLLPALVGAGLATQSITITNSTQPDLSALATKFEALAESVLVKALERLDERESCARAKGKEPTCTRDNVVLRKE